MTNKATILERSEVVLLNLLRKSLDFFSKNAVLMFFELDLFFPTREHESDLICECKSE